MFLSRIRPDADFAGSEAWQNLAKAGTYGSHRLLWLLFGDSPERDRDFLFRFDWDRRGRFICYALSDREPAEMDGLKVASKSFAPKLREGQTLGFRLRVNPTVSRREKTGRRGKRHDVMMDAKKEAVRQELPPPDTRAHMEQAARDWLLTRAGSAGFSLAPEEVLVAGYEVARFRKKKAGHQVTLGLTDFEGRLHVTDPEAFGNTLRNGLGHGKGFGCGLMLIRPIR